jgi:ABC-2 type transport system permease protein
MVKLWATFKLLLISNYFTWRTAKGVSKKQIGLLVLVGLSLLPFLRLLFELSSSVYQAATMLGDPSLTLLLAAAAGLFTVLVFGVPYLASAFYYEDDFTRLAPLPLAPWQLAGAKLLMVWLGELLTLLLTVAPLLVVYGLRARPRPWYWLLLPLMYLLLPALPLAVATPVTALVMRLGSRFRDRDKARVLFSLLFLVLVLGLQAMLVRSGDDPSIALQEKLLARPDLAAGIGSWLPPAVWFQQTLAQAGTVDSLWYLLLFALVSGIALIGLTLLAPGVLSQALAEQEAPTSANNKRKKRKARHLTTSASSSPFIACLWREARLFWRTPIFALNGTINLFLLPLIILFPLLVRGELNQLTALVAGQEKFPMGRRFNSGRHQRLHRCHKSSSLHRHFPGRTTAVLELGITPAASNPTISQTNLLPWSSVSGHLNLGSRSPFLLSPIGTTPSSRDSPWTISRLALSPDWSHDRSHLASNPVDRSSKSHER